MTTNVNLKHQQKGCRRQIGGFLTVFFNSLPLRNREAGHYFLCGIIVQVLTIISGLGLRIFLPLSTVGDFVRCSTIFSYLVQSHLGARQGLERFISIDNSEDRKKELLFTAINFSMLVYISFSLSFLYLELINNKPVNVFVAVCLNSFLLLLLNLLFTYYRSERNFIIIMPFWLGSAVIGFLAKVPMAWLYGERGFLLCLLGLSIFMISVTFLHIRNSLGYSPVVMKLSTLNMLLRSGTPMFLSFFLLTYLRTVDRIVLMLDGNNEVLGLYSLVVMVQTMAPLIPTLLMDLKFADIINKTASAVHTQQKIISPFLIHSILWLIFLQIGGSILLPPFVAFMLPEYISITGSALLAIWLMVPMFVASYLWFYIYGLSMQNYLLVLNLLVALSSVLVLGIYRLSNSLFVLSFASLTLNSFIPLVYGMFLYKKRQINLKDLSFIVLVLCVLLIGGTMWGLAVAF